MKKLLTILIVCVMALATVFGLTACENGYSASGIESNLKAAGYSVAEGEKIVFEDGTDTSSLKGLQKIYLVMKGESEDREVGYILVFDSIGSADGLSDLHLVELGESATYRCGSNKKDVAIGRSNNVAYGAYKEIKTAAKINN